MRVEDCGGADGGEFEAREGCSAGGAFAVDVVEGSRGGASHVVVEHAFEGVEVRVSRYIGDDVGFVRGYLRGFFPGVDGVEGKKRVRFVYSNETSIVASIDHEPEVLFVRVVAHGVD